MWKIQTVIASTGWSWYNNVDDIDDELYYIMVNLTVFTFATFNNFSDND